MAGVKKNSMDKWLALFVVIIGTFMAILDSSIVNIAVPKLMAVFGVSLDDVKWVLTAYTLALGAIIPLTGFLGDTLGTKKLYMAALAMFTLGSLLCGLAWNNSSMVAFRVVQALGGGMIMPVGMAIIYQTFPIEERGMALGFWGISAMAAPAIGPTLGGYIIENLDWRIIFTINVPIGIVGVILAGILLKESPTKKIKQFDYIGFISSTVGIVSLLYVMGEGTTIDWSDVKNPLLIALGTMSLLLFVVNELTCESPLLDLKVLKIFEFTMSQTISLVLTFALMGGVYVIPLFLQNVRGYTPLDTGIILFPSAIAMGIMMPISGALFDRFGIKPVVLPGMIILGITSYQLVHMIELDSSKESITLMLTLRGLGLGLAMMPLSTAGMNVVPKELVGNASALQNTIRQIAGALSVTLMTTLIQNRFNYSYSHMSEQITASNNAAMGYMSGLQSGFVQGGMTGAEAQGAGLSFITGIVQKTAYLDAMKYAIAMSVIAIIISGAGVLLMGRKDNHGAKDKFKSQLDEKLNEKPEPLPAD